MQKTFNFQSVSQCADQQLPANMCSDAYLAALAEHRRQVPVYTRQADCEEDFADSHCQADAGDDYTPRLSGFQLQVDGRVTQSEVDAAKAHAGLPKSSGGFGASGLLMGLLIGNMLSKNGADVSSAPTYYHRDLRGNLGSSTLSQRLAQGTVFEQSRQTRSGTVYSVSNTRTAVLAAAPVSRGGFGGGANARSGWGGSRGLGG